MHILIIILDRGKENLSNVKVELKETLDITQFVLMRDKDKMVYNLYAVLTHFDQSHFVASCKNPFDINGINLFMKKLSKLMISKMMLLILVILIYYFIKKKLSKKIGNYYILFKKNYLKNFI